MENPTENAITPDGVKITVKPNKQKVANMKKKLSESRLQKSLTGINNLGEENVNYIYGFLMSIETYLDIDNNNNIISNSYEIQRKQPNKEIVNNIIQKINDIKKKNQTIQNFIEYLKTRKKYKEFEESFKKDAARKATEKGAQGAGARYLQYVE